MWAATVTAWDIAINWTHVEIHPKGPLPNPLSMDFVSSLF